VSSSWALGVLGTYNGDYFRILMEERITQFPFSVVSNPMYLGSTLLFVAHAIWHHSPTGLLLSAWVYFMYRVGLLFEEPFTGYIYAQAAIEKALEDAAAAAVAEAAIREAYKSPLLFPASRDLKLRASENLDDEDGTNSYVSTDDENERDGPIPKRSNKAHRSHHKKKGRLEEWTVEGVCEWVEKRVGLPEYTDHFRRNHVDGTVLTRIDLNMLKHDLHVSSLGHRFKIMDAIKDDLEEVKASAPNKWISERRAIEGKVKEALSLLIKKQVKTFFSPSFFNLGSSNETKNNPSPSTGSTKNDTGSDSEDESNQSRRNPETEMGTNTDANKKAHGFERKKEL